MDLTALQRLFVRICRRLDIPDEQIAISLSLLSDPDLREGIDWVMDVLGENREPTDVEWLEKLTELNLKAIRRSRGK